MLVLCIAFLINSFLLSSLRRKASSSFGSVGIAVRGEEAVEAIAGVLITGETEEEVTDTIGCTEAGCSCCCKGDKGVGLESTGSFLTMMAGLSFFTTIAMSIDKAHYQQQSTSTYSVHKILTFLRPKIEKLLMVVFQGEKI